MVTYPTNNISEDLKPLNCTLFNFRSLSMKFEILTSVTIKGTAFWDVTPCNLVGTRRL
jgi:hypothetical protein